MDCGTQMKNTVWNVEELSKINNVDRLVPCQPILKKLYAGPESQYFEDLERVILSVHDRKTVEEKWDIELKPGFTYAAMGADVGTLYFYQYLVRSSRYKSILEFGTYIGVSALFWSEAVGESGEVVTVEIGDEFYSIAGRNFKRNNATNIRQVKNDALSAINLLKAEGKTFDCIFIDAAKEVYDVLFYESLSILNDNGSILVDDIFFQGEVLNSKVESEKGKGVKRCIELAYKTKGTKAIIPIGNGLLLFSKR